MNTRDNAQVREKLEQTALFAYFTSLAESPLHRIVLYSIFPYTAAANLSDAHAFAILDDLDSLVKLNSGNYQN
ncbi:MAG: hypothetical protein MUC35_02915 [Candidatus Margulisbacteria bacterium]|jgi:hypothetical protein|nr:hypothetical protein [Candidatus Margulisiibacteriota bacterium]